MESSPEANTIGPYRVVRELARGGMGVVYVAEDAAGRQVALKLLLDPLSDATLRERFAREAEVTARFQHPGVVGIHASGEHQGRAWYAMPLVEGEDLRARIKREGPLDPREAVEIARQVADALAHIHARGVLHRDLKPDNVLLAQPDGRAVLTDFGVARLDYAVQLTQTGQLVGTPAYMAPEQANGELDRLCPQSDVYALGATLYAALTGVPPFGQEARGTALLVKILREDPPPPSSRRPELSPDLDALVLRCLGKEPGERYADAADLRDDLERYLAGREVRARPRTGLERLRARARRNPLLSGALLLGGAACLLAGLAYGALALRAELAAWSQRRELERQRAEREAQRSRRLSAADQDQLARAGMKRLEAERGRLERQLAELRRVDAQARSGSFRLAWRATRVALTPEAQRALADWRRTWAEVQDELDGILDHLVEIRVALAGLERARGQETWEALARCEEEAGRAFAETCAIAAELTPDAQRAPAFLKSLKRIETCAERGLSGAWLHLCRARALGGVSAYRHAAAELLDAKPDSNQAWQEVTERALAELKRAVDLGAELSPDQRLLLAELRERRATLLRWGGAPKERVRALLEEATDDADALWRDLRRRREAEPAETQVFLTILMLEAASRLEGMLFSVERYERTIEVCELHLSLMGTPAIKGTQANMPGFDRAHDLSGQCHLLLGDPRQAHAVFSRWKGLEELGGRGDPVPVTRVGQCERLLGNPDRSWTYLRQAAELLAPLESRHEELSPLLFEQALLTGVALEREPARVVHDALRLIPPGGKRDEVLRPAAAQALTSLGPGELPKALGRAFNEQIAR